jgi:tetratricopeptide (TPR) repeat protein
VLGTPQYMSPEQVTGLTLDARSDLYAFGIMFYEMLTGTVPFKTETMMATLVKRTQEAPPPPDTVNPDIPRELNDIVVCCTALNRDDRYASATEIIADLNAWEGVSSGTNQTLVAPTIAATRVAGMRTSSSIGALAEQKSSRRRMTLAIGGGAVVALGGAGWFWRDRWQPRRTADGKPVTTLVADFDNGTGDPIFDGTLEPLLTVALEGASFIHSFNRGQARQILSQVKPGAGKLDAEAARLVAVREGLNVVVSAYLRKEGSGYLLTARAVDAVNGAALAMTEAKASSREDVLKAVPKLAAPIRRALGDTVPESAQLAAAETFSSASLAAVQAYSRGQDAQLLGKTDDAIRFYSEAIRLDAQFGRAYSGLGVIYRNLRQREESEKYFKLALRHIGQMSEREKYRTRGGYYVLIGDYAKARDEYSRLVAQFPADSAGHANLAIALLHLRELPKAIGEGRKAIEIYPRNASQRLNLALYLLYSSDFEAARQEAQKALELNPRFEPAILVQALSDVASGSLEQAANTYERLSRISPRGASMASIGLADLALYEGRISNAMAMLQKGAADDAAGNNLAGAGRKQIALANAHLLKSQPAAAVAAADKAAAGTKDAGTLLGAGMVYATVSNQAKARAVAEQLRGRFEGEPQAFGRLVEGALLMSRGKSGEAVKLYREAQTLVDTWIGRFLLGQAYLEAKAFAEADSEFDLCLKRRGEVTDLFFDYVPTCRYLPLLQYYQGRVHVELGSSSAAGYFKAFLKAKEKGEADAQVADAKRRLAKLGG